MTQNIRKSFLQNGRLVNSSLQNLSISHGALIFFFFLNGWLNKLIVHRDDLSNLLEKSAQTLTVTVLLQSLQQALEFETFLSRKYSTSVGNYMQWLNVPLNTRLPVGRYTKTHNFWVEACEVFSVCI